MPKFRVLIADDELPARNKMKRLLKKINSVELVHAAENGFDALEHIHSLKPNLVFNLKAKYAPKSGLFKATTTS